MYRILHYSCDGNNNKDNCLVLYSRNFTVADGRSAVFAFVFFKVKEIFLQCNNSTSCELPTVYNALSWTFNLACHYCFVLLVD